MKRRIGNQARKRFVTKRAARERAEAKRINERQRRMVASGLVAVLQKQAEAAQAKQRAERAASMSEDYMFRQYEVSTNGSADEDT
jgi:hypothetical protein